MKNIRKWIFAPLCIAMLFLFFVIVVSSQRFMQQQIDAETLSNANHIQQMFRNELVKDADLMSALIDVIKEDSRLRRAWVFEDRKKLQEYSLQIFRTIRSKHSITHFYFHTPEQKNFLRVHNPSRYGDFIDRYTMKNAAQKGTVSYGIELGPYGTFTLRVVHPWIIKSRLGGYIELGEEIEHITTHLKKILGVELIIIINKQFLNRSKWQEGLNILGRTGDWNQLNDFVVIDDTVDKIPQSFMKDMLFHQEPSLIEISTGDHVYSKRILPLLDASGLEVGKIIALYDISDKKTALKRLISIQIIAFVVIFIGLLVFFWRFLRLLESRLESSPGKSVADTGPE